MTVRRPPNRRPISSADRPLAHHLAVVDDHHPVAARLRLVELVGGEEQRRPVAAQLGQHLVDALAALGVHADRRLVQEHDARAVQHAAGDVEPPLHAPRERLDEVAGAPLQAGPAERPVDRLAQGSAGEPLQATEHLQVLARREHRVERHLLGHDPQGVPRPRRLGRAATQLDGAAVEPHAPRDRPHERRLARPVGTEQGEQLAGPELDRHAGQGDGLPERLLRRSDKKWFHWAEDTLRAGGWLQNSRPPPAWSRTRESSAAPTLAHRARAPGPWRARPRPRTQSSPLDRIGEPDRPLATLAVSPPSGCPGRSGSGPPPGRRAPGHPPACGRGAPPRCRAPPGSAWLPHPNHPMGTWPSGRE